MEITAWIKALARVIHDKLATQIFTLQTEGERDRNMSNSMLINSLGEKLDILSKDLKLYHYNSRGKFQGQLKTVSHAAIQHALVICPDSVECENMS